MFRRISKSSTSKAISSPPEEQPVTSKEDNTVVDIGPNLAQRTDLEETDKILRGLEISRFGAIKYGKFGLALSRSQTSSASRRHTQERPLTCTLSGDKTSAVRQSSSKTKGHILGQSLMYAQNVDEALPASQTTSHTRGYTLGRNHICARSVDEALLGNQTSSRIRGHTQGSSLMCARSVARALA